MTSTQPGPAAQRPAAVGATASTSAPGPAVHGVAQVPGRGGRVPVGGGGQVPVGGVAQVDGVAQVPDQTPLPWGTEPPLGILSAHRFIRFRDTGII